MECPTTHLVCSRDVTQPTKVQNPSDADADFFTAIQLSYLKLNSYKQTGRE